MHQSPHIAMASSPTAKQNALSFLPANGSGVCTLQLAQVNTPLPTVDQVSTMGSAKLGFEGNYDQFLAQSKSQDRLKVQMKNKVKKCSCGKPCAFTLTECNSCGASLVDLEITYTNNVFMGFIYGLQGMTVSLRYESESYLCFDDLLQLSVAHLNCIPTSIYCPDWRLLLKNPKEGLKIVNELFDTCWEAFVKQFYGNDAWRTRMLKGSPSPEALKKHVIAGFNYPPSQYQLHLQFIVPPMVPFHYFQYKNGIHYTPKRFFPIEYVRKVLELNHAVPDVESKGADDIIQLFNGKGVEYDSIHSHCYARYDVSHNELANWNKSDFSAVVVDGVAVYDIKTGSLIPDCDTKSLQATDKHALQSYGRPYDANNKPSTKYYSHPRKEALTAL